MRTVCQNRRVGGCCQTLPIALAEEGHDVRVILPKYRVIDNYWKSRMEHVCQFNVLFGWETVYCGIERVVDNGVTYYFVDNETYFGVTEIYGDGIFRRTAICVFLPRSAGSAAED